MRNPINVLCEMIAKMKDEKNYITIPGFYDNVIELSNEERQIYPEPPFSLDKYKDLLDLSDIHGEEGYSTMERTESANFRCKWNMGWLYWRRGKNSN